MLDTRKTPFSRCGSYLALVGYCDDGSDTHTITGTKGSGLYLKSVRNSARPSSAVLKIDVLQEGTPIELATRSYDPWQLTLEGAGRSLEACFVDEARLLVRVRGGGCSLYLDSLPGSPYDYAFRLKDAEGRPYFVLNSYRTQTKYFLTPMAGEMELVQAKTERTDGPVGAVACAFTVTGDEIELLIQEIPNNMCAHVRADECFEVYRERARVEFETYTARFPVPQKGSEESYREAVYTSWSATVSPSGLLKRSATWMSNTFFPGVWSWDHCFNAVGFMVADPVLAYNNMAVVFDYQDEWGQLPGSVNDANLHWNFSKPPIQGLFVQKMLRHMDLSSDQLAFLFEGLCRQVSFWLTYRDCNGDGIPEYHHGNDSGYDNSTVFDASFVVDSPDLTAYLICAMDAIEEIGPRIARDVSDIASLKRLTIERFCARFVVDDRLVARDTVTDEVIDCRSILPLTALVIARYLPKRVVEHTVADLKEHFVTEVGLATEQPESPCYDPDGYWRGPVWAPEMVIMIDALADAGEEAFACDLAQRFMRVMERSGFAENFNAETGAPLRDPAHTWTSGSYLYLMNTYGTK